MGELFLQVLNRSIAAGWLILVILALRVLLKRAPRWSICLLWALAAVRLCCPVSIQSELSVIPDLEAFSEAAGPGSSDYRDGVQKEGTAAAVLTGAAADGQMTGGSSAGWPSGDGSGAAGAAGEGSNAGDLPERWLPAAGIVWAVGMSAMLAYAVWGYLRTYAKVRTAVRICRSVYVSEFVDTPFIFGLVRPRIYIPLHMSKDMREPVIAHERAHLARRDYLWKLAGYGLLAVYWFHPLCWAAYLLFDRDIELACDERVIREYDVSQKKRYAEALLACSQGHYTLAASPLAFGESSVAERIRAVMHYKKPAFWVSAAAVAICAALCVCFLTDPVKQAPEGAGAAGTSGSGNPEMTGVPGFGNDGDASGTGSNREGGGRAGTDGDREGSGRAGTDGDREGGGRAEADGDREGSGRAGTGFGADDGQTEQDGEAVQTPMGYIRGFDGSVLTVDAVEWVVVPGSRADELGLTEDDAPGGFTVYNPETQETQITLSDECRIEILDWQDSYQPRELSPEEFAEVLSERGEQNQYIPYEYELSDGRVIVIREHYVP